MEVVNARTRSAGQIARSRSIGTRVGTLIGAGWMAYGLSLLPNAVRFPLGLVGLGVVVLILRGTRKLITKSRSLPEPTPAERAASRRTWLWFWLNFVGEIILLNVAVNLLSEPSLRVYWIPAISLVVGLHFLPMASFFRVPSYWVCGGAMMAAAVATTLGVRASLFPPTILVGVEAFVNACILWATAGWGLWAAASLTTEVDPAQN